MASYEEYAKKFAKTEEGLDVEIAEAKEQETARVTENAATLPDRFVGKTAEEIAASYVELEKLNSRQAQDLGAMRKMVDQIAQEPIIPDSTPATPTTVTPDDLWEDPDAAIRGAVESSPVVQELRQVKEQLEMSQREAAVAEFAGRHPDHADILKTPEFQNWVVENPTRSELAVRADSYDMGAADALFSLYKAEKNIAATTAREALKEATLESGTPQVARPEKTFSRQEFLEKQISAKQGNLAAERWVNSNLPAYRAALASGNVRD